MCKLQLRPLHTYITHTCRHHSFYTQLLFIPSVCRDPNNNSSFYSTNYYFFSTCLMLIRTHRCKVHFQLELGSSRFTTKPSWLGRRSDYMILLLQDASYGPISNTFLPSCQQKLRWICSHAIVIIARKCFK